MKLGDTRVLVAMDMEATQTPAGFDLQSVFLCPSIHLLCRWSLTSALHGRFGRPASLLRYQTIGIQKEQGDKKMVGHGDEQKGRRGEHRELYHASLLEYSGWEVPIDRRRCRPATQLLAYWWHSPG